MPDGFLGRLPLDGITAARVWLSLPPEVRVESARALYSPDRGDPSGRRLADAALASALRFREASVRQWPIERRVEKVALLARLDESTAAALLLALHLGGRRPMLAAFLDDLGIDHEEGAIRDTTRLSPPPAQALASACDRLFNRFAPEAVEVYLASLLALDPDTWGGVAAILERRISGRINPP